MLASGSYLVLPDGRMDFVAACPGGDAAHARIEQVAIIGPSSLPSRIPVIDGQRFFGVRLRPGHGACLGVEPASLVNSALRGAHVLALIGPHAAALMDARGDAAIREAMHALADEYSSRSLNVPASTHAAIALLHAHGGRISVSALAEALDLPKRTLLRHMQRAVGLPTKVFADVLRFQNGMRLLLTEQPASLAEVAAACGYSDQAHLTREFQRFGGFTPARRLAATLVTMPMLSRDLADSFKRPWGGAN